MRRRLLGILRGGALLGGALLGGATPAHAFPWMIKHGYARCAQCHADPSGGGVLTPYGRGAGEILLPTVYTPRPKDWEPGTEANFLYGAVTLPEALALQFDTRHLVIPEPGNFRWIAMQADLRSQLDLGPVRAYASAGWVSEGGAAAWITSNEGAGGNAVSREHWIGVDPLKGLLIRAGRMNLPFGIRSEEHILYTRSATRTDTNDQQQTGLAVGYNRGPFRGEAMAIAGNFQVRPDDFRERGYSAYVAYAPVKTVEVGVSSLYTSADLDIASLEQNTRQAHGVFGRVAIGEPIAILAEADLLRAATTGGDPLTGAVGALQVDAEVTPGVHVRGTGEWCDDALSDGVPGVASGWLTAQWFFTWRTDIRIDAIRGTLDCLPGAEPSFMGLAQLHLLL